MVIEQNSLMSKKIDMAFGSHIKKMQNGETNQISFGNGKGGFKAINNSGKTWKPIIPKF